tara:strand:- start:760 stop:1107 length:348 start_codon:yes stop_codon:yes gene_type:complete
MDVAILAGSWFDPAPGARKQMENAQLLQSLEAVAGELAVEIRQEDLEGSSGGLYRLHGHACILVDRNLSVSERVDLMARSLARLPLDGVFMPPTVRQLLENRATPPPEASDAERP